MLAEMTQKRTKPSWAVYEEQVFELFKEHFPAARIRKNVRVKGRFSKRKRQIDILMTETTPAGILSKPGLHGLNAADTLVSAFNRTVQVFPEDEGQPPQPENVEPVFGFAVRTTELPFGN